MTTQGTESRLLSFGWTLWGGGALVLAESSCAHPPPRRVQTNWGESLLVFGSPNFWWSILSFAWQCLTGTWLCNWKILGRDLPNWQDTRGALLKDTGRKYPLAERYRGSLVEGHWDLPSRKDEESGLHVSVRSSPEAFLKLDTLKRIHWDKRFKSKSYPKKLIFKMGNRFSQTKMRDIRKPTSDQQHSSQICECTEFILASTYLIGN